MRKLGMILISLFIAISAYAETDTILISDVDDTLKVQNVLDLSESAKYVFDDRTRFYGMNTLFRALEHDNQGMKFFYVSRAPQWLMSKVHRAFLANGKFPVGQYYSRSKYSAETHKFRTISAIIDAEKPLHVIFIGDNSEADPEVYEQLEKKYMESGIQFFQYIRDAYNTPVFGGKGVRPRGTQKLFVTPIEIALELETQGLLNQNSTKRLIDDLVPAIVAEVGSPKKGTIAFPYFVRCQDFKWYWDQSILVYPILEDLKTKIYKRCQLK